MYCSYDYNKGIAYFDNLSLKAVAGESYTYNDQNAVTRVDTPFGSTVNSYDSNGYRLSNQSVNGRGQSVTYSGQPRHPDDAPELQQRQPENKLYIRRLRQRQGNEAVQPVAQPGHHRKVCVFQRPLCNGLL